MTEEPITIGDVVRDLGITARAARFYEGRGLVSPRRVKQQRLYSTADVARLRDIIRLARYGFTLAEIKKGVVKRDLIRQHGELRQKIVEMEAAAAEMARVIDGTEDGSHG